MGISSSCQSSILLKKQQSATEHFTLKYTKISCFWHSFGNF